MFGIYLMNVRDDIRSDGFTKDISPIPITDRRRDPYFGCVAMRYILSSVTYDGEQLYDLLSSSSRR